MHTLTVHSSHPVMRQTAHFVRRLGQILCVAALSWVALPAQAVDLAGVHVDDVTQVAGAPLKLNGAGVRTKFMFKVYVAALYLPETKSSLADMLPLTGPRRLQLVMLRDLSASQLSEALMEGLHHNSPPADLARMNTQITQLGKILETGGGAKKGDILLLDWLPNEGTVTQLNGKRLGAPMADIAFYNALMKIWLGDKPADSSLKVGLLGSKS